MAFKGESAYSKCQEDYQINDDRESSLTSTTT